MTTTTTKIKGRKYIIENAKYSEVKGILDFAVSKDYEINVFIGSLLDNYFITGPMRIKNQKTMYQHCLLLETYVNSKSSLYKVIFTNDNEYFEQLLEKYQNEESELEDQQKGLDHNDNTYP